jgi:uncharacterized protein (TIGR00251 family)
MPRAPLNLEGLRLTERNGAVRIEVRAKPRASRSAIVDVREGALHVALAAPPVDGEANAELIATLADALGVPRRQVALATGAASRNKIVEIVGLTAEEARDRLRRHAAR